MRSLSLILALVAASPTSRSLAVADPCPAVTFSNLVANPITGAIRGTEISIAMGQTACVVLVKVADGRFGPTQVGNPALVGDSLTFRLSNGTSFAGAIVRDTLFGRFDHPGAQPLSLARTEGALHTHDH